MDESAASLVTVIAVCYNHERFVTDCLESIRAQTYPNIQLIIMDDCSRDHSVRVIQEWIRNNQVDCLFIAHEQNMGMCKTLNQALEHAKGKYISIVAVDDVWLPELIMDRVLILETRGPDYGLVYGRSFKIDSSGSLIPGLVIDGIEVPPEGFVFNDLVERCFVSANTVLIRAECFSSVGHYDEQFFIEDYDMALKIAKKYKFAFSPAILSKYRVLATSVSHSRLDDMETERLKILLKHMDESPEYEQEILERVVRDRAHLYKIWHPFTKKAYWTVFKQRKGKRDLLALFLFNIGVPYSVFRTTTEFWDLKMKNLFTKFLKRFSPQTRVE